MADSEAAESVIGRVLASRDPWSYTATERLLCLDFCTKVDKLLNVDHNGQAVVGDYGRATVFFD